MLKRWFSTTNLAQPSPTKSSSPRRSLENRDFPGFSYVIYIGEPFKKWILAKFVIEKLKISWEILTWWPSYFQDRRGMSPEQVGGVWRPSSKYIKSTYGPENVWKLLFFLFFFVILDHFESRNLARSNGPELRRSWMINRSIWQILFHTRSTFRVFRAIRSRIHLYPDFTVFFCTIYMIPTWYFPVNFTKYEVLTSKIAKVRMIFQFLVLKHHFLYHSLPIVN